VEVEQVMNLTDVDDKIIIRREQQGKTITQVTDPVVEVFHADREYLRIEDAEHYPRATAYIPQMIALVERLIANGVAYQADDGAVYFAIASSRGYGRLSRLDTREIQSGARVAQDDYSEGERAGLRALEGGEARGRGVRRGVGFAVGPRASGLASRVLGDGDVHSWRDARHARGGIDLVFPHHEDEIAQSEAATGKEFARCWCHGEFLLTDGAKMAKRVGNVQNVAGLKEAGISGAAVRHFMFSTHYRKQLNLSGDALEASVEGVRRIGDFAERLKSAKGGTRGLEDAADRLETAVREALFDDLNAPEALAALYQFITCGEQGARCRRDRCERAASARARGLCDGEWRARPGAGRGGGGRGVGGVGRGAAGGAKGCAGASGLCGGGRDSCGAGREGDRDRGRPGRDALEAGAIRG
jgi:cysteinyl-tRNA synthetase